jgi:N-sulfoglucosamine sulfohydrolase
MLRRQFLQNSAASSLLSQSTGGKPVNFVFLISDDHTAADLGCYGNPAVTSPNLDRLAKEGMRFEKCFVTSPQCSPNRSSIFTGCTAHTTGTSRLHVPLPPWEPTIIDALKQKGYHTGLFRKHHHGAGFQRKLDFFGDAKAPFSKFFETKPKDKPFWLQVGFTDPHRPYRDGAFQPPHDPKKVIVPKWLPDWPEVRKDLAHYYDFIARMDAEVGQVMELLRASGHGEDTMVIMTGDNGMPFPRAKGTLYEAGIHVPMLAWMPGKIAAGSLKSEMISHVDLASTWFDAAGIAQTPKMQGRSFLPLLVGKPYQPRTEVFCERNWHDTFEPMRSIRTDRHKLIFNASPHFPYRPPSDLEGSPTWQAMLARRRSETPIHLRHLFAPTRPAMQLFELAEDPLELNNLIESPRHVDVRVDLERRLSNWMNETYDFLPAGLGAANDPLSRSWPFTL